MFRDYLRTYPNALKEYQQLKVNLAAKYRFDRISYTKAKAPFIQKIINKAKEERD
ncbi:GrpB family protein [Cytobacillus sp. FSL W8-0315]|uniref:GrpB family protein n=1 Tax=Cytobacillus sp. FSL W8-0315 TaxID=2921600 RepID=UPI0030F8C91E